MKPLDSTQLARLTWSLPTAVLVYLAAGDLPWWSIPALTVSFFAGLALLGHGAHMIYDNVLFLTQSKNKTEALTFLWPKIFGTPDLTWSDQKVYAYNLTGMGFISLVRNAIGALPLFFLGHWVQGAAYAAFGSLAGFAYLAGWKSPWPSVRAGEAILGAANWAALVLLLAV